MRAELGLPSVKGDDEHGGGMTGGFGGSMGGAGSLGKSKRPINVKFEIPYFTTSGIQVRYLKITEPKVCIVPLVPFPNCSTDRYHSCNTPLFLGFDTLHNQAILRSGCRMRNEYKVFFYSCVFFIDQFISTVLHGKC